MENMILIDLETKDLSVTFGGIYEVGAMAISNGKVLEKLHLGIIEDENLIHSGYGHGYEDISFNKEMITHFKNFINKYQFPLVAHNASFDKKFLVHFNWIDEDYPFFDSIRAIKYKNSKLFSYSMTHLIDFLNLPQKQNHTALDDVKILFDIINEFKPDLWIPLDKTKQKSKYKNKSETLDSLKKEFDVVKDLFSGKNIVFTGKGPYVRNILIELAKKCGANANSNSVTKKTDILVMGEDCGKKLEKAKELGIEILSMKDFFEMVNILDLSEIAATNDITDINNIKISNKLTNQIISLFPMRQAMARKVAKIVESHNGVPLMSFRQKETTLLVYEPYAENFATVEKAKNKNIKTMSLGEFNKFILDLEKN